jgi:hypothetical protein
MRHTLSILLLVSVTLLTSYFVSLVRNGKNLRERERTARATMTQILQAQERRRQEFEAEGRTESAPYAFLGALLQEQRIEGLVEVHPKGEARASSDLDPPQRQVFEKNGYYFHLRLRDRWGLAFVHPDQEEAEPSVGQRYECWAWPADSSASRLVLYFASSAGYLIQGENLRHLAGLEAILPTSVNPVQALHKDPVQASQLWIPLLNIRE